MPKLFGATKKELEQNEDQLDQIFKSISSKNNKNKVDYDNLLSSLDETSKTLKKERRIKGKEAKGDFIIVNERGYQHLIDSVYTFLKLGPKQYENMRKVPANHNISG